MTPHFVYLNKPSKNHLRKSMKRRRERHRAICYRAARRLKAGKS